jgi:hypothetical protein
MAATFTGKVSLKLTLSGTDTFDVSAVSANAELNLSETFTAGTGSGKIDLATTDIVTTGSATTSYDLDGGALLNLFGTAVTYAKLKTILVQNTGTGSLTVGGDALSAGVMTIPAGGIFFIDFGPVGYSVVATTGDVIEVTTTATSFKIMIAGATA